MCCFREDRGSKCAIFATCVVLCSHFNDLENSVSPFGMLPIQTERLIIDALDPKRAAEVVDYFERNRTHLTPWEPARPVGFYGEAFWKKRLQLNRDELISEQSVRLFIEHRATHEIIGTVNFNNIVRGAFQATHLGYSLDESSQGRSYMFEALSAAIATVFAGLGLHRVMANYQPTNERSGRLLRRLGFAVEGYARDYLYIDGAWRDHVLTSVSVDSFQRPIQASREGHQS